MDLWWLKAADPTVIVDERRARLVELRPVHFILRLLARHFAWRSGGWRSIDICHFRRPPLLLQFRRAPLLLNDLRYLRPLEFLRIVLTIFSYIYGPAIPLIAKITCNIRFDTHMLKVDDRRIGLTRALLRLASHRGLHLAFIILI